MSGRIPWRELSRTALHNILAHRLRSFLTVLGIVLGVFAVILVVSILGAGEKRLLKEFRADQGQMMSLSPWTREVRQGKARMVPFDELQIQELRSQVPQIQRVSRRLGMGRFPVSFLGAKVEGRCNAVDEHAADLLNLGVAHGRDFTASDRFLKQSVVILGAKLAKKLGLGPDHIGRTVLLGGQSAELVGLLKEATDMLDSTGEMILVPLGSFTSLQDSSRVPSPYYTVFMADTMEVRQARECLEEALRRIRGVRPGTPDNFTVQTNEQALEEVGKLKAVLLATVGGMVGISLLVGGVGVMNIMLVTVSERTREIGLRKSLGARRRDVLLQFLLEACILCGLGGALGLVLGTMLGDMIGRLVIKAGAGVPLWAILTAIGVPAGCGLVFGLYPARKAAALDPIEALRTE